MRGALPKPAALRQRANKSSTRATLPADSSAVVGAIPKLPERDGGWHAMVLAWWSDVWRSPMASEYLQADIRGLYRLAALEHDFWSATSATARRETSAEIRQVGLAYGLSPIDRRRLQWEVERGDEAAAKTEERRSPAKKAKPRKDPRQGLKIA